MTAQDAMRHTRHVRQIARINAALLSHIVRGGDAVSDERVTDEELRELKEILESGGPFSGSGVTIRDLVEVVVELQALRSQHEENKTILAVLLEAYRKYVRHLDGCGEQWTGLNGTVAPCDCGVVAVIDNLPIAAREHKAEDARLRNSIKDAPKCDLCRPYYKE